MTVSPETEICIAPRVPITGLLLHMWRQITKVNQLQFVPLLGPTACDLAPILLPILGCDFSMTLVHQLAKGLPLDLVAGLASQIVLLR
uniref:Uncharacterized protein n=1 Tax=Romanomermis culicivorax TaxID=13658 RepID=A0A915I4P7_ROMCU